MANKNTQRKIILIDPLEGLKVQNNFEIFIPKRNQYIGSPVALREPIALEYISSYLEKFGYSTILLSMAITKEDEIIQEIKKMKMNF